MPCTGAATAAVSALRNKVRQSRLQTNRNMKEHRNKYIKVRMTPEEVREFKEKSAEYKTVSHYVRKALESIQT